MLAGNCRVTLLNNRFRRLALGYNRCDKGLLRSNGGGNSAMGTTVQFHRVSRMGCERNGSARESATQLSTSPRFRMLDEPLQCDV